jgi:predicted enzyme related to lactoylglutathione lyase
MGEDIGMGDDNKRPTERSDARVTGYCAMRLPVRDLTRSVAFYCDVVDYKRTEHAGETE